MQTNQPMTVDSVQNKELLWTTLQESGAFAGLSGDQFHQVHAAFDNSVQQASKTMSGSSTLSDINKHIIRQFVQLLRSTNANTNTNANMNLVPNNPNNTAPKKKKIEMVYRAEDLQTERASEFDRQLREKQAEMDSFLTLKKPTDVSFTDAGLKEDKPIGDEMSRLIAQELATRERELVQLKPEDIKKAQQWIGATSSTTNELTPPNNSAKKSVSFSNMTNIVEEEHEVEQFEPNNDNAIVATEFGNNSENFEETDFIFSKFKKIKDVGLSVTGLSESTASLSVANAILQEPSASLSVAGLSVAGLSIQQLYNKLLELEENMNTKHTEIMAHLKGSY